MRFGFGYQIRDQVHLRREYRRILDSNDAPLMICPNHLTMVDSAIIAWALGSPGWYLRNFHALPWNVPERTNFSHGIALRVLSYLFKCIPIQRGGPRKEVQATMSRFGFCVENGEVGMVFPEGGRSRSGRIDVTNAAYGVGGLIDSIPRCRVLCVYLRGDGQGTYSNLPHRNERFSVIIELFDPKTESSGLRAARDISQQIVGRLAHMEREYFDDR